MEKVVLIQYLIWQFIDSPKSIFKGWYNLFLFSLNYFSVPILLRTFFSHWHRYHLSYGKAFSPSRYFEAFVFNMFSRIIGAILRTIFIIIGLVLIIFVILIGIIIILGWFALPLLLIFGLLFGLNLIFS